jgi:hypothetical protein
MKFQKPIYTNKNEAIIPINGQNYFVQIDIVFDENGVPDVCLVENFRKTDLPETYSSSHTRYYCVKWGGYPHFIQNEYVPLSDDFRPYTYICTVDNRWGDAGNCNIFFLFKDVNSPNLEIEDVFMEASCS